MRIIQRQDACPGATALEFLFVLPLLLTLLLGAIDFGRFAHSYLAVINAARSGAAYGSTHPYTTSTAAAWNAGLRQAVDDEMNNVSGYDPTQLTFTITRDTDSEGISMVRVDLAYPYRSIIAWPVLPTGMTLRQGATMRSLRG